MTISVFDRFQNMVPTTVFDAADVSMVILIDPPEIPAVFMKNKGVLNTTDKKIYIYGDDGSTVAHTFDISTTDLGPINEEIASLKTRVGTNEGDIAQLKIDVSANTAEIAIVKAIANDADALSKTNAALLVDALLKNEYGWDVDNLNVFNVSRLSRTNNAINSSGVSIGDADVNLHGDTVGITSSNSASTYAVFSAGGLNLNNFPLTRVASGGDTDTNGANIGDVKRISTSGSGLKPVDETWDMLGYTVLNVGTSDEVTSAATVGQVNAAKTVADAADTLSKANATRIDNLPPPPDLSGYVKNGDDVNFGTAEINIAKITKGDDNTKFSDILIDGNTNTQVSFVGDTHFFIRDKSDNSKGLEAFQVDSSARFIAKQKIKAPIITNTFTGTTNSNTDKAGFVDFSEEGVVSLGAKSKVAFHVAGNGIIEAVAAGLKFLRDVDANNHNLTNIKHLVGNSTGSMNVANVHIVKRDDSSDGNQSIQFNAGDLTAFSDKHEWKTNDNARRLTIENHKADWHDCQLNNIADAENDKDAPNLKQLKTIVSTKWFEIVTGNLASDGNRPTGSTSDTNLNVWHSTVSDSSTNPPNELKIDSASAVKEALSWTNSLRYKLVQGDKVQYWDTDSNGWSTSGSVWHLSATKVSGDDLTVGAETIVYASFLEDNSGNSPTEIDGFKKYVQPTSSVTYYSHLGDSHLYIEYIGNGGTISLDTMRSGSDQNEDITVLHNTTSVECTLRLFFNGSSVAHTVPPRSYIQGWANREMGRWATVITKEASEIPSQLIVKSTDLSWTTSSDPRVNTQRMITAAPPLCTIIGLHKSNGTAKEKIISVGDTNRVETQTSSFVVNKSSSGHATGICTSEESSGKTWSRILDGSRGAWFTNESANSRMASVDIDPSLYPENQIFFTTDLGIMETYIIEDTGDTGLRVLEGYNVPKNEADIAALEVQTEKNRSVTHYFINETSLSYDWPDSARKPLVEVQVLNTTQTINNSNVTVTDNNDGKYTGTYNAVGAIAINSSGNWANVYTYHNAYKHDSSDYYVVFNQGVIKWQIIEAANPHTSIGEHAAAVTVNLGDASSLPASFGDYEINPNFDNIDSLEFMTAEVPVQYDDANSKVIINFNGAKPSGYVVLK